jgi:hypothetical protein
MRTIATPFDFTRDREGFIERISSEAGAGQANGVAIGQKSFEFVGNSLRIANLTHPG